MDAHDEWLVGDDLDEIAYDPRIDISQAIPLILNKCFEETTLFTLKDIGGVEKPLIESVRECLPYMWGFLLQEITAQRPLSFIIAESAAECFGWNIRELREKDDIRYT